jgi:uncharacterized surface protein with fasciclin (FAS1) repeats
MKPTLSPVLALVLAVIALVLGAQVVQAQDVAPAAPAANPVVNIGHFAPFGATPAETSVSVLVNGTEVFSNVVYPQMVSDLTLLPAGTYTVEIAPTGTTTPAISAPVTIVADTRYDLYAIGGANGYTPTLVATAISTTVPVSKALVTIGHLAPFDSDITLTTVNVCTDDGVQVPGLANVPYGAVAANLELAPGVYDLKVVPAANGCGAAALDLPAIELKDGKYYDVYVIGTNTITYPLEVKSFTGLDFPTATVNVGHFAPFAEAVAGTAVDVRVNGTLVITDFVFGKTATNLVLPADDTLVEILLPMSDTVVLSDTFPLMAGGLYDLYAIGGTNDYTLTLGATVLSTTVPAGKALVTIGHLAPFASPAAATAVNICTDAGDMLLPNVEYGTVAANLALDPGIYDLKIVAAGDGCGTAALDLPPLLLAAGDIRDAYAIGLGNAAFPLALVSMTGLQAPVGIYLPYVVYQLPSVVEIAQSDPNFSILVEALNAAGLADDLAGPGPFTVFAPTNSAFTNFLQEFGLTKEQFLTAAGLPNILKYHVLGETLLTSQITNGMQKPTLQGDSVLFAVQGSTVTVNGAPFVGSEIEASNGVVHVIGKVLLPATR